MSAIAGLVATHNIVPRLVRGLQQLDQAGHNTCGLAVYGRQNHKDLPPGLHRQRWTTGVSQWQAKDVDDALQRLQGRAGLAYSGKLALAGSRLMPQVMPHVSQGPKATLNSPVHVAVVHHGSLHNQQALRQVLLDRGYRFKSQSDTEVVAHLIDAIHQGQPAQTLHRALGLLSGPLAVGVMFHDQPERLFAMQRGVPLHWATGPGHAGWSSDTSALMPGTSALTPLREAEVLEIYPHEDGVCHQLHT
jgi:glucosamine--fructose-6-phosphate aminotransferase (isomerizing)